MKIIGISVILGSLLLIGGGVFGVVFNLSHISDPYGLCTRADKDLRQADTAVKQWEAARGTFAEAEARKNADTELAVQRIAEKACADTVGEVRMYAVICAVAAVTGLVLLIVGIGLMRNRGRSTITAPANA